MADDSVILRPSTSGRVTTVGPLGPLDALIGAMLLSYPVLWVVGLGWAYWPALAALSVPVLVGRPLRRVQAVLLLMVATIVLSVPFGLATFDVPLSRGLAAMWNASAWIAVAALLSVEDRHWLRHRIETSVLVVVVVQGLLISLSWFVWPRVLPVPINLVQAFSEPPFARFTENRLMYRAWFDGQAFRSSGIMGSATWSGAFGVIGTLTAVAVLRRRKSGASVRSSMLACAALVGGAISVWFSLSRLSWFLGGLLVLVALAPRSLAAPGRPRVMLLLASLLVVVATLTLLRGNAIELIEDLDGRRSGSSVARSNIYSSTIEAVASHPLPLVGYGVKPESDGLLASVASHSTVLGMLFRGGLVALVSYVILSWTMLRTAVKSAAPPVFAMALFVPTWSLAQDLDVGHLVLLAVPWVLLAGLDSIGDPCEGVRGRTVVTGARPPFSALPATSGDSLSVRLR